jgi:hypothetical protein
MTWLVEDPADEVIRPGHLDVSISRALTLRHTYALCRVACTGHRLGECPASDAIASSHWLPRRRRADDGEKLAPPQT